MNPYSDLPLGLGAQMMQDLAAMEHFTHLPPEMQQRVIQLARQVGSRREMDQLVSALHEGKTQF